MVPADVLLHINMLKDPLSDVGIARRVVERLNKMHVFLNRFELSALDEGKIKVASIIKFALRYLVTINPIDGKASLYNYWDGDKEALLQGNEVALNAYIGFCAGNINMYFSAVREVFQSDWDNPGSKLLSVTAINGFIIAYNRQLEKNGIQEFEFYRNQIKNLSIDYSKENFPYTSSQYRKFSTQILTEAFGLSDTEEETAAT